MKPSALIGAVALFGVAAAHVIPSGDNSPGLNLARTAFVVGPAARVCDSLEGLISATKHQSVAAGCYYLTGGVRARPSGAYQPVAFASSAKLSMALGKPVPPPDVTTTAVEVTIESGPAAGRTVWAWGSAFTNSAPRS